MSGACLHTRHVHAHCTSGATPVYISFMAPNSCSQWVYICLSTYIIQRGFLTACLLIDFRYIQSYRYIQIQISQYIYISTSHSDIILYMLLFSICSSYSQLNSKFQIAKLHPNCSCRLALFVHISIIGTSTSCSWGRVARVYINKFSALLDDKWGRKYKGSRSQRDGGEVDA